MKTGTPMLKYNQDGLIPAIVQDIHSREVLMMAYMNEEALERTLASSEAWFWSRSRAQLWHKGETSGNFLHVKSIITDCDSDTLLLLVEPVGPVCHTGARSCFFEPVG